MIPNIHFCVKTVSYVIWLVYVGCNSLCLIEYREKMHTKRQSIVSYAVKLVA